MLTEKLNMKMYELAGDTLFELMEVFIDLEVEYTEHVLKKAVDRVLKESECIAEDFKLQMIFDEKGVLRDYKLSVKYESHLL